MDDNHWLVEWLAYHWFALPLRHLTVYVDPNSATSPHPIFERWDTPPYDLTVHVWNGTYVPRISPHLLLLDPNLTEARRQHLGVVDVQSRFLRDCMLHYKSIKWPSWVVLVDTDEVRAIEVEQGVSVMDTSK